MKEIKRKGFTLIELLIVIAIIGLLTTVGVTSLNVARQKSRDAVRVATMKTIVKALELYRTNYGTFPPNAGDVVGGCGGWDTTADGAFLVELNTKNLIAQPIKDPTMNTACGNYRYYFYPAGTGGCDAKFGGFYVLGVNDMERTSGLYAGAPGWKCPGQDWSGSFEWPTGDFVN